MDVFGRKPLIIISSLGTFISMTIIGCYFYFSTPYLLTTLNFIPFLFTLIYSFLFSIGLGPIALLLPSELFPANVKAKASAIASICQASSAFLPNIIWLDFLCVFFGSPSSFTLKPKERIIVLATRQPKICDSGATERSSTRIERKCPREEGKERNKMKKGRRRVDDQERENKTQIVETSKLINLMSTSIICDRVACVEDRKQRAITVKKKTMMLLMMMRTCWKAE
ncbi:hypothetical protein LSTR_LSTR011130 [Laodelphax striatellus]|uniref:Major facilitator superfamily (MFS) profile domain-containing protein n=1 Tax=Laodelphax striatellus TaxID=195883 RepID=A0A482X8J9_LAOST|nr:hypothetical protein LSTR_LSTR011130 [Laodelphax striatellus]